MGYFEIGVYHPRHSENVGSLWRSAYQLGAAGIFTIGRRYQRQPGDVFKSGEQIPLRHYPTLEDFLAARPVGAVLIGIETGGIPLSQFRHPEQAVYLLGSEANGLPERVLLLCNAVVSLETMRNASYNVAVTGSIVLYHRAFLSSYNIKS